MIGDRDAGVFFNPRDFGTEARFYPAEMSGQGFALQGVFTAPTVVGLDGVQTTAPTFTIPARGVTPRRPERGDRLEIDGARYRVAEPQTDGDGLVRLPLTKGN